MHHAITPYSFYPKFKVFVKPSIYSLKSLQLVKYVRRVYATAITFPCIKT